MGEGRNEASRREETPSEREVATRDLALVRAVLDARGAAALERAIPTLAKRFGFVPSLVRAIDDRRGARLAPEDVEDLAQDVLALLWRKLDQFHGEVRLEGWVYRFVLLEYLNHVRKVARRPVETGLPEDDEHELEAPPSHTAHSIELLADLEAALCQLPPADEEVVREKLTRESTFEEIGSTLGMSPNTAKTRYYRGIEIVRRFLARGQGAMGVTP